MFNMDNLSTTINSSFIMVGYGPPGIGKTTLADYLAKYHTGLKENLMLRCEEGQGISQGWDINNYNELLFALQAVYNDEAIYNRFGLLTIDTVTKFEPMLLEQLMTNWNVTTLDDVGAKGGGYYKWRQESLALWNDVIDWLLAIRRDRGISIIILGHMDVKRIEPPSENPYNKYNLRLANPDAVNLLYENSDIMGFINYEVFTTDVKDGSTNRKAEKKQKAIGTGTRTLFLEELPAFCAKNRYGLPAKMPLSPQTFAEALMAAPKLNPQVAIVQPGLEPVQETQAPVNEPEPQPAEQPAEEDSKTAATKKKAPPKRNTAAKKTTAKK